MDRVRLGRVLGRGARLAARTAYEAVQAASAPSPGSGAQPAVVQQATILSPASRGKHRSQEKRSSPPATRHRPNEIFAPFRKATRAVSLEVTGSFFALFTLSFALGVWHQRAELHAGSQAVARFVLFCAVTAFFAYCSVSSFLRARRLR